MNTRYRLYYQEKYIGEVIVGDSDFPNMSGTFQGQGQTDNEAIHQHINRYIDYCIVADSLIQSGDDLAWEKFVEENEMQFLDLIEADDWTLRDETEVIPILIPVFLQNNEVVWRLNFGF